MIISPGLPHFLVVRNNLGDNDVVVSGLVAIGALLVNRENADIHIQGRGCIQIVRVAEGTLVNLFIQAVSEGLRITLAQILQFAFNLCSIGRLGRHLLLDNVFQPSDKGRHPGFKVIQVVIL